MDMAAGPGHSFPEDHSRRDRFALLPVKIGGIPAEASTRPALVPSTPCAWGNTRHEIPARYTAAYVRHTATVIL